MCLNYFKFQGKTHCHQFLSKSSPYLEHASPIILATFRSSSGHPLSEVSSQDALKDGSHQMQSYAAFSSNLHIGCGTVPLLALSQGQSYLEREAFWVHSVHQSSHRSIATDSHTGSKGEYFQVASWQWVFYCKNFLKVRYMSYFSSRFSKAKGGSSAPKGTEFAGGVGWDLRKRQGVCVSQTQLGVCVLTRGSRSILSNNGLS